VVIKYCGYKEFLLMTFEEHTMVLWSLQLVLTAATLQPSAHASGTLCAEMSADDDVKLLL